MTKQFITTDMCDEDGFMVYGDVYPIDTAEQIAVARAALREAGLDKAAVYAGDPECPDSYTTGAVLFA
mgnify:CR=1 FL=1